jgi:acetyl esterase/lipase
MVIFSVGTAAPLETLPLWPEGVPGNKITEDIQTHAIRDGVLRYRKVCVPTLEIHIPQDVKEPRAAVVICPGGAYARLAYTHEGLHTAEVLNTLGMVAAVLMYRLPDDHIMTERHKRPLQDAQRALQILHKKSNVYHIDPNRIGIMGFSAGGHLAATVSTHYNEVLVDGADRDQVKPDFSLLIYPVISMTSGLTHQGSRDNLIGADATQDQVRAYSNELQVRSDMAPVFLLHAADDTAVTVQNSLVFFEALRQENVPVEMFIMDKGGHGFGLRPDSPTSRWFASLESFLKSQHIL